MNILTRINWIDILCVILLFRISYIAYKRGFSAEIFKFAGTVCALFFSLHYYYSVAQALITRITFVKIPLETARFFTFIFCAVLGYLAFVLLRFIFSRFIHMEATPQFNNWGGLSIGILRGVLFLGLLFYVFCLSPLPYFSKSVKDSLTGKKMVQVSVNAYSGMWQGILSKFLTKDKLNEDVLTITDWLNKK